MIKHIQDYIPSSGFRNYHEPFLGGGSIFFHLGPRRAFLSDLNGELILTYKAIRDNVELVIDQLRRYENSQEFYYEIRNARFDNDYERASQFIYLNQTSFNGIYRVNLKGEYNVPYGYRTKDFFEPDCLREASARLKSASVFDSDFSGIIENVKKRDLVFLDPPYTVTHNHNGFIKYNKKLFSLEDQIKLAELIDKIRSKGAYYILTNAAHAKVKEIFDRSERVQALERASLIGGKEAKRGKFKEYVFSNVMVETI